MKCLRISTHWIKRVKISGPVREPWPLIFLTRILPLSQSGSQWSLGFKKNSIQCCNRIETYNSIKTLPSYLANGNAIKLIQRLHKTYLDSIFLQYASLVQLHPTIECRLASHRQQDAIWLLSLDHILYKLWSDRYKVDAICLLLAIFVGLHWCYVWVHQDCLDVFFLVWIKKKYINKWIKKKEKEKEERNSG